MRIALITRRYPPLIGGAEKVLSYLAPALAEGEGGNEVTVLTSRIDEAAAKPEREEVSLNRGKLTICRLPTSPRRFLGTWLYMRNLRHWLEENRPDLAYVSMLKHDAYVAVGVGQRLGFPVVLRPEGAGETGDLAWQKWGRFGRRIARRCHRADAIVAISKGIRLELLREGYEPSKVVDLPNGVPVPEIPWQRREAWKESPRAIFVGRLAPEKGLDTLLDAWPEVLVSHPNARLTLVGEGPERPTLQERIDRLGLADSVEMPGAVEDVEASLRTSDLFVLPSREEGMSIALLEAMALGMPIVASSIPGNRRLVADLKQGRLVRIHDAHGFARVILAQWADFDRAIHMGRSARSLVTRRYSIAAVAREHLALFDRLVRSVS